MEKNFKKLSLLLFSSVLPCSICVGTLLSRGANVQPVLRFASVFLKNIISQVLLVFIGNWDERVL